MKQLGRNPGGLLVALSTGPAMAETKLTIATVDNEAPATTERHPPGRLSKALTEPN